MYRAEIRDTVVLAFTSYPILSYICTASHFILSSLVRRSRVGVKGLTTAMLAGALMVVVVMVVMMLKSNAE